MTENEALKLMESLQISKDCELIKTVDFKATVIKALEDLQQYRALGTVEELKTFKDGFAVDFANMGYEKGLRDGYSKAKAYYKEQMKGFVKEQPTAYNMDAVVAELEKESYQEWCDSPKIVELKDAIDIVRNAGKGNEDERK